LIGGINIITLTKPDWIDLFKAYCKVNNKWGVRISLPWGDDYDTSTQEEKYASIEFSLPLWNKYWKSKTKVMMDAVHNGYVIFLCDTEQEMNEVYNQVREDDGLPNDKTPGDCYACTCSPEGVLLTENT
jgi:hypothetical protein